jgi:hypothetical protein
MLSSFHASEDLNPLSSQSITASQRALTIDEIVRWIVQYFHVLPRGYDTLATNVIYMTSPDLCACATVNRAMSACALDLLWESTTPWRLARLILLATLSGPYAARLPPARTENSIAYELASDCIIVCACYSAVTPTHSCTWIANLAARLHGTVAP